MVVHKYEMIGNGEHMDKIKVAIIGSGNIGMDLLYKIKRSKVLECEWLIGRNPKSENLKLAKKMGYKVSAKGIQTIIENPDCCDIVFDATSADAHISHAAVLKRLKKYTVDLTPARVGCLCVPCLNGDRCMDKENVNMVTCGGQAIVPMAYAVTSVIPDVEYVEMVSTIASGSAGAGTRANIDEYIHTTTLALKQFTQVERTKAMMVLNPAIPPITMRNTLYIVSRKIDLPKVTKSVERMEKIIQDYVPGYRIIVSPTMLQEDILTITIQVEGSGDYLPRYAGNLDIITCAAIEIAEKKARELLRIERSCPF